MLGKKLILFYLFSLLSAVVLADDGGDNSGENIVQTTQAPDDGDSEDPDTDTVTEPMGPDVGTTEGPDTDGDDDGNPGDYGGGDTKTTTQSSDYGDTTTSTESSAESGNTGGENPEDKSFLRSLLFF